MQSIANYSPLMPFSNYEITAKRSYNINSKTDSDNGRINRGRTVEAFTNKLLAFSRQGCSNNGMRRVIIKVLDWSDKCSPIEESSQRFTDGQKAIVKPPMNKEGGP